MTTVTVRYEGGTEARIDIPAEGTNARALFDESVACGRYTILADPETAPVAAPDVDDDRPAIAAAKAEWVAYAATQGATEDELAEATKAQLVEKYGA